MLRWRFKRKLAFGLGFLSFAFICLNYNFAGAVDGDIDVEVGILPILTITAPSSVRIVLEPGGPASVAEMPVNIATNNQTGLHATVSLDKVSNGVNDTFLRSLVNDYDSSYYLEPLEDAVVNMDDFPFDHWGCTFEEDMRYEGLNTSDKPSITYLTHNVFANEKRYFLCAARASKFQVAGLYSNTIMMTAVPNVVPDTISSITYMQEMNETVIASMETDHSYQLVDGRDKKIYWVTKLRDGRVWMTQNLDYDLEAKTDGTELAEWGEATNDANKLYKDGGNLIYDTDTDSYIDGSTVAFNSEKRHYQVGSFYNIDASDIDGSTAVYADASGLCPFSWTVPDSASSKRLYSEGLWNNLASLYGSSLASSLYLAPMGYINDAGVLSGVGSGAYYLSNVRTSSSARNVVAINGSYSTSISSLSDVSGGFIRCVAVPGRKYVIAYKNATNSVDLGGGVKPAFEQAILPSGMSVITYDTHYSLNTTGLEPTNIPEGYTFLGWTTDEFTRSKATVSGTLNIGTTQEVIRASDDGSNEININIFPAWEHNYEEPILSVQNTSTETRTIDDIDYMQEVTPEMISNTPYGTIAQLIDNRDGKRYWVRKLSDDNLWMEQNLDLSFEEARTLTPDDSNVTSDRTLAVSDENVTQIHIEGGYYNGTIQEATISSFAQEDRNWRFVHGSQYNKNTVLAGSDSRDSSTGDYSESICPKGWQLPSATGVSDTFYRDNYNESAGYTFNNDILATASSVLSTTYVAPLTTKYSYTQNLTETGKPLTDYSNNADNYYIRGTDRDTGSGQAHVVSIPGATELHIDIYSAGESCCDYYSVWEGNHPEYTYSSYGSSPLVSRTVGDSYYNGNSISGTYNTNGYTGTFNHIELTVTGDTVTFAFKSDSSVTGYGYFAIITNAGSGTSGNTPDSLVSFNRFDQSTFNLVSENYNVRCVAKGYKSEGKTLRHISTMQEMRPEICAATAVGTEVQLTDTRDKQTYFVRKMENGKCWMVQNLALGKTSPSLTLSSINTDALDKNNFSFKVNVSDSNISHGNSAAAIFNDVVTIEYGYPFAKIDDIPMNSYFRKFYPGVYYNYMAANAGMPGIGSICPRGWRLPSSADELIPDENYSREKLGSVFTGGELVDYDQTTYMTSSSNSEEHEVYVASGEYVADDDPNLYPVRCVAR